MKPLTLVVLAAGMGSRYGGLKQIDPMGPNGETVLDYSVFDAIRAGFTRVIFIIREEFAEQFQSSIGSKFATKISVDYAYQVLDDLPKGFEVPEGRTKPWGTAHAIRAARHLINEPFAVINADDFYGRDSFVKAVTFLQSSVADGNRNHYAMIGYELENTLSDHGDVNRGVCNCDENGYLSHIEEVIKIQRQDSSVILGDHLDGIRREVQKNSIVSMNFWVFSANFMNDLEDIFIRFLEKSRLQEKSESYLPSVVDELIHEGKADCQVMKTNSSWFGVTYPEDKSYVMKNIVLLTEAGDYPSSLY
jgi:NDP-sugar pyrophosphorylase family protein